MCFRLALICIRKRTDALPTAIALFPSLQLTMEVISGLGGRPVQGGDSSHEAGRN